MDYLNAMIWYLRRVYRLDESIKFYNAAPFGLPGDCLIPF